MTTIFASPDDPLPWQAPQDALAPGRVAQAFASILAAIGTPPPPPKQRGQAPGRAKGEKPLPRPRDPTVKKRVSKPRKAEQTVPPSAATAASVEAGQGPIPWLQLLSPVEQVFHGILWGRTGSQLVQIKGFGNGQLSHQQCRQSGDVQSPLLTNSRRDSTLNHHRHSPLG